MLEVQEVQEVKEVEQEEKVWLVAMPSRKGVIDNTSVDYVTVGALMLESKRDPIAQTAGTRYLYLGSISGKNLNKFCEDWC